MAAPVTRDWWAYFRGVIFAIILFWILEAIIGYPTNLFGAYGTGGVIGSIVQIAAAIYLGRYHEKKVIAKKNRTARD